MGVAIEFLQKKTGRSFDTRDMMANFLGITAGGLAGIVIRSVWAYIRREWKTSEARRRLVTFRNHAVVLREGDCIDEFFVIKSGRVRFSRSTDGKNPHLATAGPGAVIGILGVIQAKPQYATVVAETDAVLYRMSLNELMDSAGGREQPVSLVLTNMAEVIRRLADRDERHSQAGVSVRPSR
jgi:CRP-like cAMP-binding protein